MPEPNQYIFKYSELVEMMVKKAGLHEGRWMLLVNFGLGAANTGPTDDQMMPTALVPVQSIGLQRAPANAANSLTVDAAEVNPAST